MSEIECPYCNYIFSESNPDHSSDDEYDLECPKCEETMQISVEWTPSRNADKIIYEVCAECGKSHRYNGRWSPRPIKYEDNKLPLCDLCYRKLLAEEYY